MASKRPIYLESTEIAPQKTAFEIQSILHAAGARHIAMDYDGTGKITGMKFVLMVGNVPFPFAMPVRVEGVQRIFKERRQKTAKFEAYKFEAKDREQAERVAWRQLLAWIKIQVAMVDAGMCEAREVFAPYLLDPSTGRTLFEVLDETRFKALPPPAKEA